MTNLFLFTSVKIRWWLLLKKSSNQKKKKMQIGSIKRFIKNYNTNTPCNKNNKEYNAYKEGADVY